MARIICVLFVAAALITLVSVPTAGAGSCYVEWGGQGSFVACNAPRTGIPGAPWTWAFVAGWASIVALLLLINVLLLVLGTFMDLAPMLLICTPIFLPIVTQFGIDPVHFGIIMILNLGIGLLTPPVGSTLAVGCAIGKVSMEAVSRSIMIFYVPLLIVLVLVTYVPALSLWLPSVFR